MKTLKAEIESLERKAGKTPKLVAIKEFGCFVSVEDGTLMYCPILANGEPDLEAMGEVTDPQSQKFLDQVNKVFQTKFKMSDF